MKKISFKSGVALAAFPLSALSLAISSHSVAEAQNTASPIEEVLILGRQKSAAQDLISVRMELEVPVDLIGAEQIGRIGDSTAAAALRRVPGLTLINGKYVYVRGLGERNSSATLNGATVPSPDLTRNVVPLDIFPASIIESISVQKGYTADMPATFGAGNINIRTKGLPEDTVAIFEISGGINSMSGDYLTYNGGADDKWGTDDGTRALSGNIENALTTYYDSSDAKEPSLTPAAIQATYARHGDVITAGEAAAINAELARNVYRDLSIQNKSSGIQDQGYSVSLGNLYALPKNFEFGILASGDYDTSIRTKERIVRSYNDPSEEFSQSTRSTVNVSMTGSLNMGLRWGEDHIIESKNLFLRNTDDETSFAKRYNNTSTYSSLFGFLDYDYRYEEQELEIYQLEGSHTLGAETRELLGLGNSVFDDLEFSWFYSDSKTSTDIPSETSIEASFRRDSATGDIASSQLTQKQRMVDVRYTELEDNVESSGFNIKLPIDLNSMLITLKSGGKYDKKARVYEQLDLSIGPNGSDVSNSLIGDISDVLSDENITNPDYEYEISYQDGLSRSYLAAYTSDAFYGSASFDWKDTLLVVIGARYEEYKQFSAAWHPYQVIGNKVDLTDPTTLAEGESPPETFYHSDVYPSLAVTYSVPDFWAQEFQLRFSASETIVLPDLREISPSSYLDPLTDIVVNGNPDVVQSNYTNYDIRGEWVFSNGDNFTLSLFYKDIDKPIEYFLKTGTEDSLNATIENADSATVEGIEIEWLKNLAFIGDFAEPFFLSGNVTLLESELNVGYDIEVEVKNRVRPLSGASPYVANLLLGFDSPDGKHSATLGYNVFGERVFSAGTGDWDDAYEQPFSSLDLSYSYYVTEEFAVKLKARNLLDDNIVIKQGDVNIFEEEVGQSFSVSFKYAY